jgi:hypothetical protein
VRVGSGLGFSEDKLVVMDSVIRSLCIPLVSQEAKGRSSENHLYIVIRHSGQERYCVLVECSNRSLQRPNAGQ